MSQPSQASIQKEKRVGILLLIAAVTALIIDNSPWSSLYDALLQVPFTVALGNWMLEKPLLLWINDGLMAMFFTYVGLEVKRELKYGHLSSWSQLSLPLAGALGGVLVPVMIYLGFNWHDPIANDGWAIPAATDIAFAIGILALIGERVPPALKLFLLSLAIIDDLAAIIIIALFYSTDLSLTAALIALACTAVLLLLNYLKVKRLSFYLLVGTIMWLAVLKSGVHATLAGVILAFTLPLSRDQHNHDPAYRLEHGLDPWINFAILPVFAFANAGINLNGVEWGSFLNPISLGIGLGLLIGKPLGVFGFCWLAVKLGVAKMLPRVGWTHVLGVSALCGIGFTMSLFISTLAFEHSSYGDNLISDRIGILTGSLLSGLLGYLLLRRAKPIP